VAYADITETFEGGSPGTHITTSNSAFPRIDDGSNGGTMFATGGNTGQCAIGQVPGSPVTQDSGSSFYDTSSSDAVSTITATNWTVRTKFKVTDGTSTPDTGWLIASVDLGEVGRTPVTWTGGATDSVQVKYDAGTKNLQLIGDHTRTISLTAQLGNWLDIVITGTSGAVHMDFKTGGGSSFTTEDFTVTSSLYRARAQIAPYRAENNAFHWEVDDVYMGATVNDPFASPPTPPDEPETTGDAIPTYLKVSSSNGGDGFDGVNAYGLCQWDDDTVIIGWTQNDDHYQNCLRAINIDNNGVPTLGTTFIVRDEVDDPTTTDTEGLDPQLIRVGDLLVMLNAEGIWTLTFDGTHFSEISGPQVFPSDFVTGPSVDDLSRGRRLVEWGDDTILVVSQYRNETLPSHYTGIAAFAQWNGASWVFGDTLEDAEFTYPGGSHLTTAARLYSATDKTAIGYRIGVSDPGPEIPFVLFTGEYPDAPVATESAIESPLLWDYAEEELVPTDDGNLLHIGSGPDWVAGDSWTWQTAIVSPDGSDVQEADGIDAIANGDYSNGWGIAVSTSHDASVPWIFLQTDVDGIGTRYSTIYHGDETWRIPSTDGGPSSNYSWNTSRLARSAYVTAWTTETNGELWVAAVPALEPNAHCGEKVIRYQVTSNTGLPYTVSPNGPDNPTHHGKFAIPPSRFVSFMASLANDNEQDFYVQPQARFLAWTGSSFSTLSVANMGPFVHLTGTAAWTTITERMAAPDGATHWALDFAVEANLDGDPPDIGTVLYLDCVYVVEDGRDLALEPYLDGDQRDTWRGDGIWEGTPHDATSIWGVVTPEDPPEDPTEGGGGDSGGGDPVDDPTDDDNPPPPEQPPPAPQVPVVCSAENLVTSRHPRRGFCPDCLEGDIQLGDHFFNTVDEFGTFWSINDIDGWWNLPDPDIPDITRGIDDGSYETRGRYSARVFTLTGSFWPASPSDVRTARDRLIRAANLCHYGAWFATHEADATRASKVWLSGRPNIATVLDNGRTDFSIGLKSPDPVKYGLFDRQLPGWNIAALRSSSSTADFGRVYDRTYPWAYPNVPTGGVLADTATVTNDGNVRVSPIITVYGPTLGPIDIHNITTDQTMRVRTGLGSDETLIIDCQNRTVTLNDIPNKRFYLDTVTDWIYLDPGANRFNYTEETGSSSSFVTVQWRSGWIG